VVRTAVARYRLFGGPAAIWSVDKNQPVARVRDQREIVDKQLSTRRNTSLLGAFALLRAAARVDRTYGVSHAVTQKTPNEIASYGVRSD